MGVRMTEYATEIPAPYRLYVNDTSTVLVRVWQSGLTEVCLRDDRNHIWGPPIRVTEEPIR